MNWNINFLRGHLNFYKSLCQKLIFFTNGALILFSQLLLFPCWRRCWKIFVWVNVLLSLRAALWWCQISESKKYHCECFSVISSSLQTLCPGSRERMNCILLGERGPIRCEKLRERTIERYHRRPLFENWLYCVNLLWSTAKSPRHFGASSKKSKWCYLWLISYGTQSPGYFPRQAS